MPLAVTAIDINDIAARLVVAVIVGAAIGVDREWRGQAVGIRTLALVCMGSALITAAAIHYSGFGGDLAATSRVMQGVIQGVLTGVGFLGAGAIMGATQDRRVHGLTTAATVWVTAALGIACVIADWAVVAIALGLTLFVLVILHPIDSWFDRRRARLKPEDAQP